MEDQVFNSPNNSSHNGSQKPSGKGKVLLLAIGLLVVLALVATGAYFAGKNVGSEVPPTSTQNPIKETLEKETPTSGPTLEPTLKISGVLTPTKNPSLTPTTTLTPTPLAKSKILISTSDLDGFRSSNNGGNSTLDIRAGRNSTLVTRGFVSFDLSTIPSNATVIEATLRLYQAKVIGNPYAAGGSIKIDHLTYGDSLDSNDYSLPALTSSFATLSSNATLEWKSANVATQVKNDLSNTRSASQFRIHFTTEVTGGDTTGDFSYIESADNSENTGNTPQLVIKYY